MRFRNLLAALGVLSLCMALLPHARAVQRAIVVVDDAGQTVRLERPAQRIVSLAPHVTEQLFAAGAGARIVGAVEYSDYPPEARRIPRVGDNRAIDIERVLAMKPDLIVAWFHGNVGRQIDQVRSLGLPVYYSQPRTIDDIARGLEQMGTLSGTETIAARAARGFRERVRSLRQRYGAREPVSVFYEIWNRPLYTVNGEHLISDVIRLCGGANVFAGLRALAPTVTQEAVLKADPVAIIASDIEGARPEWLDDWKAWPDLQAVKLGNLFFIDSDLINRHGPRIVDAARQVCEMIDLARTRKFRR